MCEDKSDLWLKKVTDKASKKDLKGHLLNNQQRRQTQAQFWFTLVCRAKGGTPILKWWCANSSAEFTIRNDQMNNNDRIV